MVEVIEAVSERLIVVRYRPNFRYIYGGISANEKGESKDGNYWLEMVGLGRKTHWNAGWNAVGMLWDWPFLGRGHGYKEVKL